MTTPRHALNPNITMFTNSRSTPELAKCTCGGFTGSPQEVERHVAAENETGDVQPKP
jgi:hypothetical protein